MNFCWVKHYSKVSNRRGVWNSKGVGKISKIDGECGIVKVVGKIDGECGIVKVVGKIDRECGIVKVVGKIDASVE